MTPMGNLRVLDVGSGPRPKLVSTYLEIEVTHCDRRKYEQVDHQNMEYLLYKDNSFDIVTCINALDHTPDAKAAIREMLRVSKHMVYINCAMMQLSQSGGHHYWNAQEDGTFTSKDDEFNIKDFGFEISLTDNGGERRYNHLNAIYNHPQPSA